MAPFSLAMTVTPAKAKALRELLLMSDDPVVFKNGATLTAEGLWVWVEREGDRRRFGRSQLENAYEFALTGRVPFRQVRPAPWIERYGLSAREPSKKMKAALDDALDSRPF